MKTLSRAKLLGAALACTMSAQAAGAAEHTILIMPDAYFPDIMHVDPGDEVIFVNTTGSSHNIVAKDEAWTIGPIPASGEMRITIVEDQETTYYNADETNSDTGEYSVTGYLSFEDAPID